MRWRGRRLAKFAPIDDNARTVSASFEPCHVLVAEDHQLSSELLERTLKSWGYSVVVADNGADALAILESSDPPQLALLDWMMPNMTGPEVCARVRQNAQRRYIYLVLLTAKGVRRMDEVLPDAFGPADLER